MHNQAAVDAMITVIHRHNDGMRLTGNESAVGAAPEWLDCGLTAETAEPYVEVGCWDPERIASLIAAGVTASQLADEDVRAEIVMARDRRAQQRGCNYDDADLAESIAYLHSNHDIDTDEIVRAVHEVFE